MERAWRPALSIRPKDGWSKIYIKKRRRKRKKKLRWIYWKLIVQWPMLASAMLRHYVAVDDERNELIWWLFTKMSSDGTTLSWPPDRPSTRKGERNTWHDIAAQSWVSLWAQGRNARIKACVKRKINLFIYMFCLEPQRFFWQVVSQVCAYTQVLDEYGTYGHWLLRTSLSICVSSDFVCAKKRIAQCNEVTVTRREQNWVYTNDPQRWYQLLVFNTIHKRDVVRIKNQAGNAAEFFWFSQEKKQTWKRLRHRIAQPSILISCV